MPSIRTSTNGVGFFVHKRDALRRRWDSFIALEPADRLLFLKLWGQLAIVSLLLRLLVVKQARRLLARLIPERPNHPVEPDQAMSYAQRVGSLTRKAGRHLPLDASCLRQSLLIWWFLRRRGLEAELRIGVNNHEKFLAHAWVELAGRPVNDLPNIAEGFQPFDRVP